MALTQNKTPRSQKPEDGWRRRSYNIIFESDTPAGKRFDVLLMAAILLSVTVVMLDSVEAIRSRYGDALSVCEWSFTLLFTIEYLMRLAVVKHPWRYACSFYGVIDLLSILPSYLGFMFQADTHYLADIRILRLLRFFRVMKLAHYLREAGMLMQALVASREKIIVFFTFVMFLVTILGTLMYVIEDEASGFTSIPKSIYWAIVTLTTVGYGDLTPKTPLGQALASLVMITGYAIIAVPTGIFSAELARAMYQEPVIVKTRRCPECLAEGLDDDDVYCKRCGSKLPEDHEEDG